MAGEAPGVRAGLMRAGMSVVSPVYSAAMRVRNWKFDRGIGVQALPRPVISVGNVTTGGTGKTPVVQWLCERLREAGERPAVLMRGYKAASGAQGDEQAMLESLLNRADAPMVIVEANADRHAGGLRVLAERPEVSVFVMDDGFQHRRLGRDFDLVLIDASNPFGYGRVLPRGLLREPMSGLRRADAFLVTRASRGDVSAITECLRRYNAEAPVFRCDHVHAGLRTADGVVREPPAGRAYAVAGIGNPEAFGRQFEDLAGHRWFDDHWNYSKGDVEAIVSEARGAGAGYVVTTEKDWVKMARWISTTAGMPVYRAELAIRFAGEDEGELLDLIRARLRRVRG